MAKPLNHGLKSTLIDLFHSVRKMKATDLKKRIKRSKSLHGNDPRVSFQLTKKENI